MGANNRIKELREATGMKQSLLAQELGVSQGTLSNWERGIHDPDNNTIAALTKVFDVTADYLLGLDFSASSARDGLASRSGENYEPMPAGFRVIARKMSDMPLEDQMAVFRIIDSTIDSFLKMREQEAAKMKTLAEINIPEERNSIIEGNEEWS